MDLMPAFLSQEGSSAHQQLANLKNPNWTRIRRSPQPSLRASLSLSLSRSSLLLPPSRNGEPFGPRCPMLCCAVCHFVWICLWGCVCVCAIAGIRHNLAFAHAHCTHKHTHAQARTRTHTHTCGSVHASTYASSYALTHTHARNHSTTNAHSHTCT